MVHQIIVGIVVAAPVDDAIRRCRLLDLRGTAGQPDHLVREILDVVLHHLWRVAGGVDGDEDRRHHLALRLEQVDRLGVAHGVERLEAGAQQAFGLLARILVVPGRTVVAVEQLLMELNLIMKLLHLSLLLLKLHGLFRNFLDQMVILVLEILQLVQVRLKNYLDFIH